MKKKKRLRRVLLGLLAVAILYAAVCAGSIWRYAEVDETRSADAAIVLGAAAYEGGPSPVYRERLNHGIWLWEQGYVTSGTVLHVTQVNIKTCQREPSPLAR